MEKKKILLVAVSVGIFLVIAIGAAILIFSPRSGVSSNTVVMDSPTQGTYSPPALQENTSVYSRLTEPAAELQPFSAPGLQTPTTPGLQAPTTPGFETPSAPDSAHQSPPNPFAAPSVPSSTAIHENNFYINGETQGQPYYTEETETKNNEQTTTPKVVISVPRPESVKIPALPETASKPAASPAKSAAASKPAASPAKPTAAPKPAASPAKPAASSSTKTAAASKPAASPAKPTAAPSSTKTAAASRPAAQTRPTYDAWWVQAGSFSTKVHADGAKETLASKGITSIIENRDLGGKTFYRVRIGPYTSQNEADYWLALIQTLDGFEGSQVWKSQARRFN
jgi:DedD protein